MQNKGRWTVIELNLEYEIEIWYRFFKYGIGIWDLFQKFGIHLQKIRNLRFQIGDPWSKFGYGYDFIESDFDSAWFPMVTICSPF